jgi:hypothetical protein
LFLCFFVSLFLCFFVSLFLCFFVSLFLCFFVSLFLCFFVSLFLCFFVSLFLCFFVSLFLKQHHRLVALQKTSVTHELEQVHTALAELEKELITSRSENDRLRHLSNSIRQSTTSSSSMSSTRSSSSSRSLMTPSTTNTTPNSHARIHVSRTGSIAITRTDEEGNTLPFSPNRSTATSSASSVAAPSAPAMVPLPSGGNASGNVRVRANRFGSMDISRGGSLTTPTEKNESSATALANDGSDPWSLGSQTNITSIRRGTYFGEFLVWKCWWCGWGGGVVGVVFFVDVSDLFFFLRWF